MSKLRVNTGPGDRMASFVDTLRTNLNSQGGQLADPTTTQNLISFESLDSVKAGDLQSRGDNIVAMIKDAASQVGFEHINAVGLEAGMIAAMASGAPAEYARAANNLSTRAPLNGQMVDAAALVGSAGAPDYRDNAAMEAFDDRELREHLPISIAFNIYASRQDPFGEMFFPTTVVGPDQGGLDVSVTRMTVFNEARHAISGKAIDFKKRNLIDAYADSAILADEATTLVPVRLEDDSNASYFVAESLLAPTFRLVSGISVPTSALAIGQQIDLLGVSQHPGLLGAGVIDNTDSIDTRMTLDAIYVKLGDGGTTYDDAIVKFSTGRLPRNAFVKTVEGNSREVGLQFSTTDLIMKASTKAVDNTTPEAVAAAFAATAAGYVARLSVDLNGIANVEIGNVKVFASPITLDSVVDASGNAVSTSSGAGATLKNALASAVVVGYDLKAARTNSNRRTRGLIVDATTQTERYAVPLASPLSVPTPLSSNRDAADLKALINAARTRNSNNAVTTLLNYAEALAAYVTGPKRADNAVPQIQGIGRYVVQPFYEKHTLDMFKAINSIKSHEKAADVQAALVNAIREVAYRAVRDSRLQAAFDALTGGTGEKPKLLVGTDQVISRYLTVSGDTRTFAEYFSSFEVQSSMDNRMKDKIIIAFGRDNASGPDPLHFGCHAWMPELASTVNVTRNGATVKESMVQPRTLHVPMLPIMIEIDVTNLSYVLVEKIDQPYVAGDITSTWL